MSFNDGQVTSTNYKEIQRECRIRCQNKTNKDACYISCVKSYDHDKCVHYRRSRGYPMHSGNMYYCMDSLFFAPSADKFGEMPYFGTKN